jgi:hypothetical protein
MVTPRFIYGVGNSMELGLNLNGLVTRGESQMAIEGVIKRVDSLYILGGTTLSYGGELLYPFKITNKGGGLLFLSAARSFDSVRLTGGLYWASNAYTSTGNVLGFLAGIEWKIPKFIIAMDFFSGKNDLSYLSPGLIYLPSEHFNAFLAFQKSLTLQENDGILWGISYLF